MSKTEASLPALGDGGAAFSESEEILTQLAEIRATLQKLAAKSPAKEISKPGETADSLAARHRAYVELIERVRVLVGRSLPFGSIVAVISKGDPELLTFQGRTGWHFPRDAHGQFAGHYPANSEAAISHLEEVRESGAEFLLIPQTALWWLDYYREFRQHLEGRYAVISRNADTGNIYRLRPEGRGGALREPADRHRDVAGQLRSLVQSILPDDARVLVISRGEEALRDCGPGDSRHFPCTEDGRYAGYHPADSHEAIHHLNEELRKGAGYLVIPKASFWWLDFYSDFADLLSSRHRLVTRQKHVALIYELAQPSQSSL